MESISRARAHDGMFKKNSNLAATKSTQENILKSENLLNEKIRTVNKEIVQKEKEFQEMLKKATADVERKNEKLEESVLKLDRSEEIKSLENQVL